MYLTSCSTGQTCSPMTMADPSNSKLPDMPSLPEQQPNSPHGKPQSLRPQTRTATSLQRAYTQPAPLKTFPLPTFYPSNPVSLVHLACAWLTYALFPPPREPATIHQGVWSPATRSIHVTNPESMRALWEQGFFGKGSLSRSEPNWLKREQVRQGLVDASVSELHTLRRREERARAKWERGRTELDALEQQLLVENPFPVANPGAKSAQLPAQSPSPATVQPRQQTAFAGHGFAAPVSPQRLLALPNSESDLDRSILCMQEENNAAAPSGLSKSRLDHHDGQEARLPDSIFPIPLKDISDGMARPNQHLLASHADATEQPFPLHVHTNGDSEPKRLRHQKSVRFSPKVESTTFQLSDPPSPHRSIPNASKHNEVATVVDVPAPGNGNPLCSATTAQPALETNWKASHGQLAKGLDPYPIEDKEHLQLSPEEAFYLVFAIGALSVVDPQTQAPLSVGKLLELFRDQSHSSASSHISPDDPFLVHYVVYHHFRSLGWVPRHGIKFGVDWMLYDRGPVFNHAEFGLLIIPSYSDPYWTAQGTEALRPSWRWFHGVNRVLTTVFKSLVLVYVDIPPPSTAVDSTGQDIPHLLGRYQVREVMIKRWSSNRNRA